MSDKNNDCLTTGEEDEKMRKLWNVEHNAFFKNFVFQAIAIKVEPLESMCITFRVKIYRIQIILIRINLFRLVHLQ